MQERWPVTQQAILEEKYHPILVRRVEIPKPGGAGVRQLGIPTVLDRIIQQAVYQERVWLFNPTLILGQFEQLNFECVLKPLFTRGLRCSLKGVWDRKNYLLLF
jgi:hypothetical protein